jgi:NADH dehydrogenase [ubiquinone] 1 alpha subcomplex assembly factor 1
MKSTGKIVLFGDKPHDEVYYTLVNDGIMGGLSSSRIRFNRENHLVFYGQVLLENNGGFASFRIKTDKNELTGCSMLSIRLKGDGKKYKIMVRVQDDWDEISYSHTIRTINEVWMEFEMPLKDFVPVYRGKQLPHTGEMKPENIRQIGLLISDKQSGQFSVEVEWIKGH